MRLYRDVDVKETEALDQKMTVVYIDANGYTVASNIRSSTGASTLLTALLACSNTDVLAQWEGDFVPNPSPSPVAGSYQPGSYRAALVFGCADGTIATLLVPAPKTAIFKADGETVDPANADVVSLVALAVGTLEGNSGSLATAFVGGYLLPLSRIPSA